MTNFDSPEVADLVSRTRGPHDHGVLDADVSTALESADLSGRDRGHLLFVQLILRQGTMSAEGAAGQAREVVELMRRHGEIDDIVSAVALAAGIYATSGDLASCLDQCLDMASFIRSNPDSSLSYRDASNYGGALLALGAHDLAANFLTDGVEQSVIHGNSTGTVICCTNLAQALMLRGLYTGDPVLADSESLAQLDVIDRALQSVDRSELAPELASFATAVLAQSSQLRGDWDAAAERWGDLDATTHPVPSFGQYLCLIEAPLALRQGDAARARELVERSLEDLPSPFFIPHREVHALKTRASIHEHTGDAAAAAHDLRVAADLGLAQNDGLADLMIAQVGKRAESIERHRYQLGHDELTGLPNLASLTLELQRRLDADSPFAILFVNLARFHEINETLGHAIADEVLAEVASRLLAWSRGSAYIARLPADEFAVVSDSASHELEQLAAEIVAAVDQPVTVAGLTLGISVNIGAALAPEDARNESLLLQRADIALSEARRSVEPFRRYHGVPKRLSVERLELMGELAEAITENQIQAWFQPKIRLGTDIIVGAEALARWNHPTRGQVSPGIFIELLALGPRYRQFEAMMIEQALAVIAEAADAGTAVGISVNISGTSIGNELEVIVEDLLARYSVDPRLLTLEVTEDAIIEERDDNLAAMRHLSELGVRFSIDDFGTGYSSFVRLRSLPFDEVKLDRSFLRPDADAADHEMVATMLDLAGRLGLGTVAEGVEDTATMRFLLAQGCTTAQGFLWSPAKPRDEFIALLRAQNATGR
jgi:diguanylate cyclase (GGDEF)-like protein